MGDTCPLSCLHLLKNELFSLLIREHIVKRLASLLEGFLLEAPVARSAELGATPNDGTTLVKAVSQDQVGTPQRQDQSDDNVGATWGIPFVFGADWCVVLGVRLVGLDFVIENLLVRVHGTCRDAVEE